jgi:hypothetical protein
MSGQVATSPPERQRSAFRDEGVLFDINARLVSLSGFIRVLDCGFDDARLARALLSIRSPRRIWYEGIDSNPLCVRALQAEKRAGVFSALRQFNVHLCEVTDLGRYETGIFQFVVANNLLHEVRPENLVPMFWEFNRVAAKPDGLMSFVDMAELPQEVSEPWSITWTAEELRRILHAGGLKPIPSSHLRSVPVYRVVARATTKVLDCDAMRRTIRSFLQKKRARCLSRVGGCSLGDPVTLEVSQAALTLTSIDVALARL